MYKRAFIILSMLTSNIALHSFTAPWSKNKATKTPAKAAPAKVAPAKAAPVKVEPAKVAPAKAVPAKVHSSKTYKKIASKSELDKTVKAPGLNVLKFHATWCGACTHMEPAYKEAAAKHPEHNFFVADVDELADGIGQFKVEAYPTTVFFVDGKEVHRERGSLDVPSIEFGIRRALEKRAA